MIPLVIVLIAVGVIVILLAIFITFALRANSLLSREKNAAMRVLEEATAGKEHLKAENGKLQQELHFAQVQNAGQEGVLEELKVLYKKLLKEHTDLEARNAALQKTLEAQPTVPKRAVPKRGAQAVEQDGEHGRTDAR